MVSEMPRADNALHAIAPSAILQKRRVQSEFLVGGGGERDGRQRILNSDWPDLSLGLI